MKPLHDGGVVRIMVVEGRLSVVVDEAEVLRIHGFDKILYADDRLPKK